MATRSTGFQRPTAMAGMITVVTARTAPQTVSRVTESTGTLDEVTTTTTDHTEDLWVYEPRERIAEELTGERVQGSLAAIAVADGTVDLEVNDRLTYGGIEYEVDTVVGHPEDDQADGTATPDTDLWLIGFTRRQ